MKTRAEIGDSVTFCFASGESMKAIIQHCPKIPGDGWAVLLPGGQIAHILNYEIMYVEKPEQLTKEEAHIFANGNEKAAGGGE